MSKFDSLKVLKKTKARTTHSCSSCGNRVAKGEIYFREHIADAFLHSLHARKFCATCFQKDGENLLKRQ
jgi:hypothetical protein